ncbi:MAG TPA: 30S ribosome-binding factor RbfA [Candidatus Deferrimicrobiaceae bacterium]|nr:30S ribosome-binding factor RbfA [Candidatus Deferrimicrobiaceae bacterium]
MKGRGDRPARVAERIREEVSLILQNKVKDPGMRVVTVTDVTVTPDLKNARIHYSVLGGEEDRLAVRDALRRSKGFIRKELGRTLQLRYSPEVAFLYDDTYEKGARIDRLLKSIRPGDDGEK